jgi:hypothetical protein
LYRAFLVLKYPRRVFRNILKLYQPILKIQQKTLILLLVVILIQLSAVLKSIIEICPFLTSPVQFSILVNMLPTHSPTIYFA